MTNPRLPEESGELSDDEVDYLLSAGGLGGSQRDAILGAATDRARRWDGGRPRTRRTWRWVGGLSTAGLAIAASWVLWASRVPTDRNSFQVKGAGDSVFIGVECLHGSLPACRRGSLLAFSVRGTPAGTLASAVLDPADATEPKTRTWLLWNEPTSAQAGGSPGLLERGARLPESLPAGSYHLLVLVTNRAISRDNLTGSLGKDLLSQARLEITVLR